MARLYPLTCVANNVNPGDAICSKTHSVYPRPVVNHIDNDLDTCIESFAYPSLCDFVENHPVCSICFENGSQTSLPFLSMCLNVFELKNMNFYHVRTHNLQKSIIALSECEDGFDQFSEVIYGHSVVLCLEDKDFTKNLYNYVHNPYQFAFDGDATAVVAVDRGAPEVMRLADVVDRIRQFYFTPDSFEDIPVVVQGSLEMDEEVKTVDVLLSYFYVCQFLMVQKLSGKCEQRAGRLLEVLRSVEEMDRPESTCIYHLFDAVGEVASFPFFDFAPGGGEGAVLALFEAVSRIQKLMATLSQLVVAAQSTEFKTYLPDCVVSVVEKIKSNVLKDIQEYQFEDQSFVERTVDEIIDRTQPKVKEFESRRSSQCFSFLDAVDDVIEAVLTEEFAAMAADVQEASGRLQEVSRENLVEAREEDKSEVSSSPKQRRHLTVLDRVQKLFLVVKRKLKSAAKIVVSKVLFAFTCV